MPNGQKGETGQSKGLPSWLFRLLALFVAAAPLTALTVASQLRPDTRGLGTHQQLGLPPCSMRMMWGMRCPGCGMTTSWAYFTQGQWQASASTNIAGFMLAWYAIGVAAIAAKSVFSRKMPSLRTQQIATLTGFGIGIVAVINWACRLLIGD